MNKKIDCAEPSYYHREYSNDIKVPSKKSWSDQSNLDRLQRVTTVALPFITLYKPLSFPVSLALGGLRTVSKVSGLISSIQNGENSKAIAYQTLQTIIAVISVAGTIFAHPLGMLITTGQDLIIEVAKLAEHVNKGDYKKALESCANILNNSLYLALFLHGGLEVSIASLATQILIGVYHGQTEFREGRFLEGTGHIAMAMIRGNQMRQQIEVLQFKSKMQELVRQQKPLRRQNESVNNNSKNENIQQIKNDLKVRIAESSDPSSNETRELVVQLGLVHAKEQFPSGSPDALNAIAHGWAAIYWREHGSTYQFAFEEVDKALYYCLRCEPKEELNAFKGFEGMLQFRNGTVSLFYGDLGNEKALRVLGESFDQSRNELQKAIFELGLVHAKEELPSGSPDALNAVASAWAAIYWGEHGEYQFALNEIEWALHSYHRCELKEEDMDAFDDFEPLLHFHKGIMHLYLGEYSKAEEVLQKEYEPYHNLGQTVLYRLVEQKAKIALLNDPERLKEDGCLDFRKDTFVPGPKQQQYEQNLKSINEAVYKALTGSPEEALEIYNSLKLDANETYMNRRHLAAIKGLNGDLEWVDHSFEEGSNMFDLDYASSLEAHLLRWLSKDEIEPSDRSWS